MRILSRSLLWLVAVTAVGGSFIAMTAHSTPCHGKASAVNVGMDAPAPAPQRMPVLPDVPTLL